MMLFRVSLAESGSGFTSGAETLKRASHFLPAPEAACASEGAVSGAIRSVLVKTTLKIAHEAPGARCDVRKKLEKNRGAIRFK